MGQQAGGDEKHSMQLLWLIAGVFILAGIIWFGFKPYIKLIFIKIRLLETYIVFWGAKWFLAEEKITEIVAQITYLANISENSLSADAAYRTSVLVGDYLRWPFSLFMGAFAFLMYGKSVKMLYKKRYDTVSLANQENIEWPQINIAINEDILNSSLDDGPWAMGAPPLVFAKRNNLISIAVTKSQDSVLAAERFTMILNKAKADRVFTQQLGRLWHGIEQMPIHARALFAAMAAKGCKDGTSAQALLRQINLSIKNSESEPNFKGADELWDKHINNILVQNIIKNHAYEFTVMIAMFSFAREDGVFAAADFLWLKVRDRKLWYVLNCVGRQTPFAECSGVFAHYLAERSIRRGLSIPMIGEATRALEKALADIIYVPDPEEKEQLLAEFYATEGSSNG